MENLKRDDLENDSIEKGTYETIENYKKRSWNINVKCFFRSVRPYELMNYLGDNNDENTIDLLAAEVGAIAKNSEQLGKIYDFSEAKIPDYMHVQSGTNYYTKHKYEYYGIGYKTEKGRIFLSSGSDPRHQYDGTTTVLWFDDSYRG